jgi:maleylpyruvate isomerase
VHASLDATWLNRCVEGCAQSHQVLLGIADALTDEQCRAPSLLSGWTRGHLLNHLARNAQRHVFLFECASRGEVGDQYPGGMAERNADIEAGAHRTSSQLATDLRQQVWALETHWARATTDTWQGSARRPGGAIVAISDLVFLRWREVAIHLVDLDVGLDHDSWSDFFVEQETSRQMAALQQRGISLSEPLDAVSAAQWLAWMIGRGDIDGHNKGPGFQV